MTSCHFHLYQLLTSPTKNTQTQAQTGFNSTPWVKFRKYVWFWGDQKIRLIFYNGCLWENKVWSIKKMKRTYIPKQESPPASMQEAYHLPCREYSFCCPILADPPPTSWTWTPPASWTWPPPPLAGPDPLPVSWTWTPLAGPEPPPIGWTWPPRLAGPDPPRADWPDPPPLWTN